VTSSRHLVIHGHFYQPPRENPFSGGIAEQPSAAPFPNWNARIARECYAPNAQARILSPAGLISRIVNNYQHISFNVGPTLMSWLLSESPGTARLMVEADRAGALEHGGHGPAMAQVFNHVIMPLACHRDKVTQIVWGREHFRRVFGRLPEGMWLAETAADIESLALMSKAGIAFTVLAQGQIDATRPLSAGRQGPWEMLPDAADPRRPYRVFWGRGPGDFIDVFVYDGPVSRSIAFESLLRDGKIFLDRVGEAFGQGYPDGWPRLVNLATDGESYGHHFQFGEMALAWLVDRVQAGGPDPIALTNYGEFLARFPPRLEARLVENSSWSCPHGIERWRSDCGCHAGGQDGWNQKWRTPLRDGLNWLRDSLAHIFERTLRGLLADPWGARDDYIGVLASDYDPSERAGFLSRHRARSLSAEEELTVWEQMEAQLMALYMFTSCGWFFDDLTGLEPVQNLRYAHRAICLSRGRGDQDLAEGLLSFLRQARPNDPGYGSGEDVWNSLVIPFRLTDSLSAAHWAAARLMGVGESLDQFRYQRFREGEVGLLDLDRARVMAGQVEIADPRLGTARRFCLASSPAGGEDLTIMVLEAREGDPPPSAEAILARIKDDPDLLARPGELLGPGPEAFGLDDLWPSVRQSILSELVGDFFRDLRAYTEKSFNVFSNMLVRYSRSRDSLDWLSRFVFRVVTEGRVQSFVERMRAGLPIDLEKLGRLVNDEDTAGAFRNEHVLNQAAQDYLAGLLDPARPAGARDTAISEALDFVGFLRQNGLAADFWEAQNLWQALAMDGDRQGSLAPGRRQLFAALGRALGFECPAP
jgi:hypothetical protein